MTPITHHCTWKKKRASHFRMSILVTGGCGFIGSHTCLELLNSGKEVIVIDNLCNSKVDCLAAIEQLSGRKVKFLAVDLLDVDKVDGVFEENQVSAVVHFAGLKAVGESWEMPLRYYVNNLTGTLNLLSAMSRHNVKKLVFSSSSTVYGSRTPPPWSEDAQLGATNPYGRTKLFLEQVLRDLCKSDPAWSIVMLRYFNPIGAHESCLIGEDPNGVPNNLIPFVCKVALGELDELKVYGGDYETSDGTCVRDYIHVVDVARGHLAALDWVFRFSGVETVNLGTGRGYSVLEVVRAFERVSGRRVNYRIVDRRAGDVAVTLCDPEKARVLFHWCAERDLDTMCRDAWRFYERKRSEQS